MLLGQPPAQLLRLPPRMTDSDRKQLGFKRRRSRIRMAKRCPLALGQTLHIFVMLHSPSCNAAINRTRSFMALISFKGISKPSSPIPSQPVNHARSQTFSLWPARTRPSRHAVRGKELKTICQSFSFGKKQFFSSVTGGSRGTIHTFLSKDQSIIPPPAELHTISVLSLAGGD
jgi:hypothetical protein